MDIGAKIRIARTEAGFTQEKAAEELGITRQTISNWENGRSYPDIISVVKMSDLYSVSLDHLLKENANKKSSYLEHLEETTNTVKSNNKKTLVILISLFLMVWFIAIALFWLPVLSRFSEAVDALSIGMRGVERLGYSIISFYVILPIVIFVTSYLVGKDSEWGPSRWFMVLFYGGMYALADYCTFRVIYMIGYINNNSFYIEYPDFILFFTGALIASIGLVLGVVVKRITSKMIIAEQYLI